MVIDEMLLRVKTNLALWAARPEWSEAAVAVTASSTTSASFAAWPTVTAYPLGLTAAALVGCVIEFGGGVVRVVRTATDATHTLTWQHPVTSTIPATVTLGSGPLAGAVCAVGGYPPARKTCIVWPTKIATPTHTMGQAYGARGRAVDFAVTYTSKFKPTTGQSFETEGLEAAQAWEQIIEVLEYHTTPVALVSRIIPDHWIEGDGAERVWCYGASILASCEERV